MATEMAPKVPALCRVLARKVCPGFIRAPSGNVPSAPFTSPEKLASMAAWSGVRPSVRASPYFEVAACAPIITPPTIGLLVTAVAPRIGSKSIVPLVIV